MSTIAALGCASVLAVAMAAGATAAPVAAAGEGSVGRGHMRARTLAPRAYEPVPLGKTKPQGWMKTQLDAQDAGLCGNQYLGGGGHANKSNWVGGPGYNGLAESYVYWLNGYIPLAAQLSDDAKLAEIKTQMDFIFSAAEKNAGWLGPLVDGSPWSSYRFATCLGQYYEVTRDPRVSAVFFRYNAVLHEFLARKPLVVGSWAQVRWQEHVTACQWLLDTFGDRASPSELAATWSLMELLTKQGFNWTGWVASTPAKPWLNASAPEHTHPTTAYIEHMDISGGDLSRGLLPDNGTPVDCEKRCNASAACVPWCSESACRGEEKS